MISEVTRLVPFVLYPTLLRFLMKPTFVQVTIPSQDMRKAALEAKLGDEQSLSDPTTNALEAQVAALFGKEAGLFVVSGTMGRQF